MPGQIPDHGHPDPAKEGQGSQVGDYGDPGRPGGDEVVVGGQLAIEADEDPE